jgi:NodT family efflux transporter outer membrane factor (OMF) lipoprotein
MSVWRTPIVILFLSGLLGGCTVGPGYVAPAPPSGAEAPLQSLNPALETSAEPPEDWWHLYDDALLDQYIPQAFSANADLSSAEANISVARALLESARNGQYPQTNAEVGGVYGRDATTNEILEIDGHQPQTMWLYDDILDVSYELDLFGRVRRSVEASRADAEAAVAARDALKITVAAETARAYAQVCTFGQQLAVARRSLEVTSREADITVQRRTMGAASEFDVMRVQQIAAQARAAIPSLEGQRRAALFELTAILGLTPSHAPAEAETCATAPLLRELIPIGDGAALLKRRPDVRLAERRLAAATARIGIATADLYPRISLSGFYGGAAPTLEDLTKNAGLTWGVGPSISWSFPNQAGIRARIHGAEAGAAGALANFNSTVLEALREAETSLAAYSSELDHREALADADEKARRAFAIARDQYSAGSLSALDLLIAEQTSVSADAAVAASDAALVQDQISVFKALGGGWRTARRG